nr:hypothetical protein HmN_000009600 [Hymenolepis microstoma]
MKCRPVAIVECLTTCTRQGSLDELAILAVLFDKLHYRSDINAAKSLAPLDIISRQTDVLKNLLEKLGLLVPNISRRDSQRSISRKRSHSATTEVAVNPRKEVDTWLFRTDIRELFKELPDLVDDSNLIHGNLPNFLPEYTAISAKRCNKRKRNTSKSTAPNEQN